MAQWTSWAEAAPVPLSPCPSTWHRPWPWWGPLSAWCWRRGVKGLLWPAVLRTLCVCLLLRAPPANLFELLLWAPILDAGGCVSAPFACQHPVIPLLFKPPGTSVRYMPLAPVCRSGNRGSERRSWSAAWTPAWAGWEVVSRGKKGTCPLQRAVPGAAWGSPEPCGHLTWSPQALRKAHGAEKSSVLVRTASRSRSIGSLSPPALLLGAGLRCSLMGEALAPVCADVLCCPPLSGARPGCGSGLCSTACRGLSWLGSSTRWLRAARPQTGDLLAFLWSCCRAGPRLLFYEVPSRWRRGSQ